MLITYLSIIIQQDDAQRRLEETVRAYNLTQIITVLSIALIAVVILFALNQYRVNKLKLENKKLRLENKSLLQNK